LPGLAESHPVRVSARRGRRCVTGLEVGCFPAGIALHRDAHASQQLVLATGNGVT
jgi:hypothetical protein